jgi:hypothetical protein
MADLPPPSGPVPTPGAIPTQPTLSPQQVVQQQADLRAGNDAQKLQQQADLQKAADKAEKSIFKRIYNKTIKPGSLIVFQYNFYKHDPSPLVMVGRLWSGNQAGMVSGVNLHYLTFRYIKYLVQVFCGKQFSYGLIKGNQYIVNAYRSYKREGRRQVKVLDCEYLMNVLGIARSFKPNEIEAIRKSIQDQLREKMHPNAEQVAKEYQEALRKQSHTDYNIGKTQPDARFNPTNILPPPPPAGMQPQQGVQE